MHLFGDAHEPHLTHFIADRQAGSVVLAWDVKNAPALNWRVLRSERDFADGPDALLGSGQTLVCESGRCGARDEKIDEKVIYYYTIFAQDQKGAWHRQVKAKVQPTERLRWRHPAHKADDGEGGYTDCGGVSHDPDAKIDTLIMLHPTPFSGVLPR